MNVHMSCRCRYPSAADYDTKVASTNSSPYRGHKFFMQEVMLLTTALRRLASIPAKVNDTNSSCRESRHVGIPQLQQVPGSSDQKMAASTDIQVPIYAHARTCVRQLCTIQVFSHLSPGWWLVATPLPSMVGGCHISASTLFLLSTLSEPSSQPNTEQQSPHPGCGVTRSQFLA